MQIYCSFLRNLLIFLSILLFSFLELQRIDYSPSISANYVFHHFKFLRQPFHRHINSTSSIVFLKTHKTGGSTVSGILFRELCGGSQSFNCFIPPLQHAGRIWDLKNVKSDRNYILSKRPYDAWIHHVRYSHELFQAMKSPLKDQVILSIVRRPSSRFVSAWHWYQHDKKLHMNLKSFVNQHVINMKKDVSSASFCRYNPSIISSFILNSWYGFKYRTGLDATTEELTLTTTGTNSFHMVISSWWQKRRYTTTQSNLAPSIQPPVNNKQKVKLNRSEDYSFNNDYERLLADVASGRLFLLVTNRMDESLIILAEYLRWDVSRMLHFNHKVMPKHHQKLRHKTAHQHHSHSSYESSYAIDSSLDQDMMNVLDECQPFDHTLYLLANHILDERIRTYSRPQYSFHTPTVPHHQQGEHKQQVEEQSTRSNRSESVAWSFQVTLSRFRTAQSKLQVICSCLKEHNHHPQRPCFNLSAITTTTATTTKTADDDSMNASANRPSRHQSTPLNLQPQLLKVKHKLQYKEYKSFMVSYCHSLETDNRQTIHNYYQQHQDKDQKVRNDEWKDNSQMMLHQLLFS